MAAKAKAKKPVKKSSKEAKPAITKAKTAKNTEKKPSIPVLPPKEEIYEPTMADFTALGLADTFTPKEMKFIFYYTMPGPDFMNQTRAAAKAGYPKKSAYMIGYQVRRKPNVETAIKNILNSKVSISLEEKYQKVMDKLESRAFFDLSEFVKRKNIKIKVSKDEYEEIEIEAFKDLTELSKEQLMAVDGVDYRGVNGTRILVMSDRTKTFADIINMRNKLNGLTDENEFDVQATADVIKGELSVKITARKNKEELSQEARYMETPKEKPTEEL